MGRGAGSSQRQEVHVPCMVKLRPGQEKVLRDVKSSVKSQESGRESQESRVEDLPGWGGGLEGWRASNESQLLNLAAWSLATRASHLECSRPTPRDISHLTPRASRRTPHAARLPPPTSHFPPHFSLLSLLPSLQKKIHLWQWVSCRVVRFPLAVCRFNPIPNAAAGLCRVVPPF